MQSFQVIKHVVIGEVHPVKGTQQVGPMEAAMRMIGQDFDHGKELNAESEYEFNFEGLLHTIAVGRRDASRLDSPDDYPEVAID